MRKILIWICAAILGTALLCPAGAGAARKLNRTVKRVGVSDCGFGPESLPMGTIEQVVTDLSEKKHGVKIDMRDVFRMYPEHTGVYGVVYAEGEITLTGAPGDETQTVGGTGVLEFSFPGAEECLIDGTGMIYGYFLPVPYLRLSTDVSLVRQRFDTSYLTTTAVGYSNMFILSDPHVYIYQDSIPELNTVYKTVSPLGPGPEGYEPIVGGPEVFYPYPFVFETPTLTQCCAWKKDLFRSDVYYARPMVKAAEGDGYEVWTYRDYRPEYDLPAFVKSVFDASLEVAREQILAPGLKVDKTVIVFLKEEIRDVTEVEGLASSSEFFHKLAQTHEIYLNSAVWGKKPKNSDYYLLAHEIGHVVQSASLSAMPFSHTHWVTEGFATWFGEKVAARMGHPFEETGKLGKEDSAEINKFHTNLVFGATDFDSLRSLESAMIRPADPYTFGSLFFRYLEDRFGEGFCKKVSERFYTDWYQGHEDRFFSRRNDLNYDADRYFAFFREALGEDVYTAYPAYAYNKFSKRIEKKAVRPESP